MNRILIIIFTCIFFACTPSEDIVPTVITINPEMYVSGEIKEEGQSDFKDFRINFNSDENLDLGKTFWHSTVSEGELSSTLILGNYPTDLWGGRKLFGLQFWSDNLPNDRAWTSEELEDFFNPGNTFNFGQGPGYVEVFLKMPIGGPYDFNASRPSYLENAQGSLTITNLENYDYPVFRTQADRSYGKLVYATFSGQLGRYDLAADQADGNPNLFLTDEVVELKDCELVFYVEYEQI